MTRTTRIIATGLLATAILAGLATAVHAWRRGQLPSRTVRPPVELNQTLDNAASDSLLPPGFNAKVLEYMRFWDLRGASLSIMRNDSLLIAKGYGKADEGVSMEPWHILRLASVSKLVTAVGIMLLQEEGKLSLSDKVFGEEGLLGDSTLNAVIRDTNYFKITVEDLLRHKGGFTRKGGDPMFSTRWIMMQNHLKTVPDQERLTRIMLAQPLDFEPGTWQDYSNFGYLLLSMIIERLEGVSYPDFIQSRVLKPCGCVDFQTAGNYYADKYPDEVRYYVQKDDAPVFEFNNSGKKVTRCYGGNNVAGLSGAGCWVASTPELALLVASIDGRGEVPDILKPESDAAMTEYFDPDTYSLGWNDTKPTGEWTRTGTFAGTSALVKYYPDGECWIFVTNTSTYKGPGLARHTAELFEELRASYSASLPSRNLFYDIP